MAEKITDTRFTIQFSRTDPSHLHVAEILNRQGRRSKAQYIVNAVLHYENCGETPSIKHTAQLDIKVIEAIVNRILRDRVENTADKPVATTPQAKVPPKTTEDINFDDTLEALGTDGLNAIAGAMEMFRNK